MKFIPGLNEDLGATMVWGTQQTNLFPGAKVEGVFGMWYGKGPGVDRTGDVFKHANAAGTAPKGGVLALAADDHACRSSTLPHGSEHEFVSAMMPVLNPAGVQDILDMGLIGWAMSRLHRALGRLQDDRRNGGVVGVGRRRSARARDPVAGRFRHARAAA